MNKDIIEHFLKSYFIKYYDYKIYNYEPIGKGNSGHIYAIQKNGKYYALKVILNKSNEGLQNTSTEYKGFHNEVSILEKLNECQESFIYNTKVIPKYYDSFTYTDIYNNDFYCIIMEIFNGDITSLELKDKRDILILRDKLVLLQTYLRLIHTKCNICIYDIKAKNILFKYISEYDYILVFSDTGCSQEVDEDCEEVDIEDLQLVIDKYNKYL